MYKEMWNLTSWTMVGHVSLICYTQGITLLINLFFGPVLNAAYSIANQATNIINQFSSSFQTAINPQITKSYAAKQYDEMHKLVYRSSKFSYFLMLIIAVPLFYEGKFLIRNLVGEGAGAFCRFYEIGNIYRNADGGEKSIGNSGCS